MHIGTFCRRMCPIYRYFACLIIATYRSLVNRRNVFLSAGHCISQLFRPFPHRDLEFCQPPAFLLLIPDSINIAFPNGSCDFIPVFFDVFQNGFIGLRQGAIGTPVKHAGRLNFRQGSEIQAADFLLCPGDCFADFHIGFSQQTNKLLFGGDAKGLYMHYYILTTLDLCAIIQVRWRR